QLLECQCNSSDVVHGGDCAHLRAQMDLVPGMNTFFTFKPTITTEEMRKITKNDKFDYVLLCNKVCGVAHYTMKMTVVVDTPEDFKKWLRKQKKAREISSTPTVAENTTVNKEVTATL